MTAQEPNRESDDFLESNASGLREVAMLVGLGLVVGVGLSLASMAALEGVLYGVSPNDPITLAAVSVALLAVAMGAALVPALRAANADPVQALRRG